MKHVEDLKLISFGFLVFYAITLLTYLQLLSHPTLGQFAFIMATLSLALFITACGLVSWREWARQLLLVLNAVFFTYGVWIYRENPDIMPLPYLLISGVIVGFYNQKAVRAYFQPVGRLMRKSVLIIDDDEGLLKTVQKVLLSSGYSVLTAVTGEKGIQIAKLQKPDLIILDVLLPGIKGREACVLLKEDAQTKDIPVLFLTAKDSPDDVAAEMAAGAEAHMTKPVNSRTLLGEVRRILG